MERVLVIGGVAAGMSAASQVKRRMRDAEVVVIERGEFVSYSACGMPYNLVDPGRDMRDLVVLTPERLRDERGIDVRLGHEALALDTGRKTAAVRELAGGAVFELRYQKLVLATGAAAVRPPIPGVELPGVFVLRELADGVALKRQIEEAAPRRAVIIGAGYIGLELAEALRARGLEVAILEKTEQVVPGFDRALAQLVRAELARNEVEVETGVSVLEIAQTGAALEVRTDRRSWAADLVLVSTGVRPRVGLAKAAGIALGETGAIAVDERMRTSAPDVFAAGDCAEAHHLVSGRSAYVPLGTTANKQGRIAGANAAGASECFAGIVGTAAFKVFGLHVARTGLGAADLRRLGLEALCSPSTHRSRALSYPGSSEVRTVIFSERASGRLLGAQMVGEGAALRIDVFAAALQARMTVDEVEGLDLAYAPPFAPVFDPILIAARVASKGRRSSARGKG